jgi:hypothetical protein
MKSDHVCMAFSPQSPTTHDLIIRIARSTDAEMVNRLALLDDQRPLTGDVLVAEIDGTILAARSMATGRTIADPFHRTANLVALLDVRAELLRGSVSQMVRGPSLVDRARHAIAA